MRTLTGLLLWCTITVTAQAGVTDIHHDLGIELDPATRLLKATDTITLTGTPDAGPRVCAGVSGAQRSRAA
ncbi:MAG: hypothetical protein Q8L89_02190 [Gammaproteobacteria bacterium]|nr:hypothetical protein [Gammaproteobacteria bacterium]